MDMEYSQSPGSMERRWVFDHSLDRENDRSWWDRKRTHFMKYPLFYAPSQGENSTIEEFSELAHEKFRICFAVQFRWKVWQYLYSDQLEVIRSSFSMNTLRWIVFIFFGQMTALSTWFLIFQAKLAQFISHHHFYRQVLGFRLSLVRFICFWKAGKKFSISGVWSQNLSPFRFFLFYWLRVMIGHVFIP